MARRQKSTIRDVAERAGVSISSVSRALSGHPHVSPDLRQRVEEAARELAYRPHFLGHSLRSGATMIVGFVVGSLANPALAEMYEATTQVLSAQGYATILVCSQNEPQQDAFYLHFLADRQVDGLLVSSATDGPDLTAPIIADLGIPTVMLDRDLPPGEHVSAVQSDHASGMRAAIAHLHEHGHRRIAYIGGPEHTRVFRERLHGLCLGLQEAGLPLEAELVHEVPLHAEAGEAAAHALLAAAKPPTAIIAAGNILVSGVMRALRSRQLVPGRDLALVGADDIESARLATPAVTVIGRDMPLLGRSAARLLLAMIGGGPGRQVISLPTWLVVRESTLCRQSGDMTE